MIKPAQKVLLLMAPTASGKTALALHLAQALNGVVINADSMQIYRELCVLTARPTAEEEATAPHRLYGVLSGAETCSAGLWRTLAMAEIAAAFERGQQPIVVGGTGFYFKALVEGLSPIPDVSAETKTYIRAMPLEDLRARFLPLDPSLADADSQRFKRGAEILLETGKPLAYWQALPSQPLPYATEMMTLWPERAWVYERINRRFEQMVYEGGALEEVKHLLTLKLSAQAPLMGAVGVPELSAYLQGDISLDHAIAQAQQASRRYAKRQFTWMRTQLKNTHKISIDQEALKDLQSLCAEILTII